MPQVTYKLNGPTVKKLMEENSMPPKVLAKKMKVNYSTVVNWRKGGRTNMENIERLAKILDCTPEVLTSKRDPRIKGGAPDDIAKIREHIQTGVVMCGTVLDKNTDRKIGAKLGELVSFFNQAEQILTG